MSVDALLAEARQRLQEDAKQAESTAEASPSYAGERKSLNAILAQKAYQGVTEVSVTDRFREWFYNLLDKFLSGLYRFGSRSPWIAFTLRALLLVAICTALIWFLVRIERRSRVRLIPDDAPAPGAPSAREWQLWLQDAHAMAAKRHVARCHPLYLLGFDCAAGVQTAVACRPRPHSARVPWPAGRKRSAQTEPDGADPEL